MGGDHHHQTLVIPDYKIYKVEDCPELIYVQKELAKKGLKDPWLRNEAWRYNNRNEYQTIRSRVKFMWMRGLKFGFAAFALTTALETVADMMRSDLPGDGHSHH